jgi:alpha-glucosidase (family GH31 glycosyl hydrolase)
MSSNCTTKAAAGMLALVFAVSFPVFAARELVKDYVSHAVNGNQVVFTCQGTHMVKITVCKSDLVRVEFDPFGQFVLPTYNTTEGYDQTYKKVDLATYMMKNDWPAISPSVTDAGTYVKIATPELTVRVTKSPFRVQFYDATNTTLVNRDADAEGMSCYPGGTGGPCDLFLGKVKSATEHFFGFGNINRMSCKPCDYTGSDEGQNPSGCIYPNGSDGEHYSAPFFYSTDGYGLFVIFDRPFNSGWQMPARNTNSQTFWDMGIPPNTTKYSVHWWTKSGTDYHQYLFYYFMYGPSWQKVIDRYTELSGRPPVFTKWVFGVQANNFPAKFGGSPSGVAWENFATGYRSGHYPLDLMFCDDDNSWGIRPSAEITGGTNHTWFDAPNTAYWSGAINKNGDDLIKWLHNQGMHFGGNLHNELCEPGDAPATKSYVDHGFDVYWRDMTGNGGMHREAKYSYENFKAAYSGDGTRAFIRHGWAGWAAQAYGVFHAGDENRMKDIVKGQLVTSLAGYPYNVIDAAQGVWYNMALAMCATIVHHPYGDGQGNRVDPRPWMHTADEQASYKKWMGFHYQMLPYLFTYANASSIAGMPVWRHMMTADPKNSATYGLDDQAYVGDWLLVAPYVDGLHTNFARNVYFPAGTWYNFFTGAKYTGPQTVANISAGTANVPSTYSLLLYAKEGAIIPMAPAMEYVGQIPEDPLRICVWPPATGATSFELWEDEKLVKTTFTCDNTGGLPVVKGTPFAGSLYAPATRKYVVEIHQQSTVPAHVYEKTLELTKYSDSASLAAAQSGWFYTAANGGVCRIKPASDASGGLAVGLQPSTALKFNRTSGNNPPFRNIHLMIGHQSFLIEVPSLGDHHIEVINALGKSVLKVDDTGAQSFSIPSGKVQAGILFVKITARGFSTTRKFCIL